MSDAVHVGQGEPQNRLFKQIGTTAGGDPILAEYVALEPGSIGVGGGIASSVTVTNFPVTQPVSLATNTPDVVDRAARLLGHVTVDNFPVTQPVSGSVSITNFPATQPVSLATNTPDVTDRAARLLGHVTVDNASIPVTGTFWQVTQPVSGTITATQGGAPWSENITQVGGVAVAATAKGTQGTNFVNTQDAKDTGRVAVVLFLDAVAGITAEALGSMGITKGGVAQTAATSYTVTAGKTLRISGLHTTVKNTSTVASDSRVRVRQAASAISVTSPIILLNEAGSPAAVAQAAGTDDTVMPDGYEVAGGQQLAISHIESAATCTVSVMLVGYEY